MFVKLVLLIAFLSYSSSSQSQEVESEVGDVFIVIKAAGMCGALKQMAAFQEYAKLEGGDHFVLKFMQSEATRLNKDLPEFLDMCLRYTELYKSLMEDIEVGAE